ncbi:hypothetical protein EE612_013779, partial [Oryza sativa]
MASDRRVCTVHHMSHAAIVLVSVLLLCSAHPSAGARRLMELYKPPPSEQLTYHNGTVLRGDIPVSVVWYGRFTPAQKAVVSDFLLLLTVASPAPTPSVSQWWNTINQLYLSKAAAQGKNGGGGGKITTQVRLAGQLTDDQCSLGKSLKAVPAAGAGGEGQAQEGRDRAGSHRAGRVRGGVLHEPVRHARVERQGPHGLRLGRQLRHAVPRPVRVAVPPAGVRASDAGAGAAQRRRRDGRHGDEHRQHGRRRRDQPVRRRVLPGPQGRRRWRPRRRVRGSTAAVRTPVMPGTWRWTPRRERATTPMEHTGGNTCFRLCSILPRQPVQLWCEGLRTEEIWCNDKPVYIRSKEWSRVNTTCTSLKKIIPLDMIFLRRSVNKNRNSYP